MATRTARTGRATAAEPGATHATGWLRGIRFSWFTFVMMGLIVIGVLIIAPTLQLYLGQRQQIADLERQNAKTAEQIAKLDTEAAKWNDPSYIRAQARDRLLYVMPGETSYLVLDDRPPSAATKSTPVSTGIQKTRSDWLTTMLGSIVTAGTTTSAPDELNTTDTDTSRSAPSPTSSPSK